jgi:hypothetical protein
LHSTTPSPSAPKPSRKAREEERPKFDSEEFEHEKPAAREASLAEGEPPSSTADNAALDKNLQEAQDAYVRGHYSTAIDLAQAAISVQPAKAWRIIGASHCFLQNKDGAQSAWDKLDPQGRQFLNYVCARNSIILP